MIGRGMIAGILEARSMNVRTAACRALAVLISIPGAIGYVYAGWPAAMRFPDVAALQVPFALGYVSLIAGSRFVISLPSGQ
jgi:hypothetical protein